MPLPRSKRQVACRQAASLQTLTSYHSMASCNDACADSSESDEARRRSTPPRRHRPARRGERPEAPAAGTAWWRKCGPAAERRANGVAYSADKKASGLLRRLPEVLPRGLRRLWDGAPCPITLAQFPARQYLAHDVCAVSAHRAVCAHTFTTFRLSPHHTTPHTPRPNAT